MSDAPPCRCPPPADAPDFFVVMTLEYPSNHSRTVQPWFVPKPFIFGTYALAITRADDFARQSGQCHTSWRDGDHRC